MSRLSDSTLRACAEARLAAKHGRDSSTESHTSPVRPATMPLGVAHRMPDHAPPARKAARVVASATSLDDASSVPTPLPARLPLGPAHRTPDHAAPAGMVPHAVTFVTSPDETSAGVPLRLGNQLGSPTR